MRIADLYGQGRPIYSFEFFPPKTEKGGENLLRTVKQLAELSPDFVSVTCPLETHRREVAELWSRFSEVAAASALPTSTLSSGVQSSTFVSSRAPYSGGNWPAASARLMNAFTPWL